jgi:endonuclease/exonuclease/phosphatase family metal-dependent hydrolase
MSQHRCWFRWIGLVSALLIGSGLAAAATFRVATYNVESYLDAPTESRAAKSAESKAKVRENIRALRPDVLALEEMGSPSALQELRQSLKVEGLDFPFWEHVSGFDTNIHVAVLSRFPFITRRPHANDNFLLGGRRFRVSRGFAELEVQVNTNYSFTLIAAHLKSKRPTALADESELRLEEAKVLREKIDGALARTPAANVIVLGDLNDSKDSASTRLVIGRGKTKLIDTRPAERNGDDRTSGHVGREVRNVSWTHYYAKEDSYSRIDFILASPGMAREWVTNETWVLTAPNWGLASDHRPIVATFEAVDK